MHNDPLPSAAVYAYRPARGHVVHAPSHPALAFDREGHALLHELYWRRRLDPRLRWISLALVLLLHVLLAWWLFVASRPYAISVPHAPGHVLIVRLIPSHRALPPPPAIALPPPQAAPAPGALEPPRPAPPATPVAPTPSNTPFGTLRLYSPGGTLLLPKTVHASPPAVAFAPQMPMANVDINPRRVVAPTRHTVFSKYWIPKNEDLLGKLVRETMQAFTVPVRLPGNTHLKCVIVPLALGGGCTFGGPDDSRFKPPKNATTIQFLPEKPLVTGMGFPLPGSSSAPAPAVSVPPPH
jgi:hypothetical protein